MSMVFRGAVDDEAGDSMEGEHRESTCPSCGHVNKASDADLDLTWYVYQFPVITTD
jgi:hypothetical protein